MTLFIIVLESFIKNLESFNKLYNIYKSALKSILRIR